ncbi:MAG: PEP-CTERM sorting domain-containing protein [Gemmatimonas sp.]
MKFSNLMLAMALAPASAIAQQIDILQPLSTGLVGAFALSSNNLDGTWTGQADAQTFSAVSTQSAGAGFRLFNFDRDPNTTYHGTMRISLWSSAPFTGGSAITSADVSYSWKGGESQWMDAFWSPISTVVGQTYWLSIYQSDNPTYDGSAVHAATGNPYSAGQSFNQQVSGSASGFENGPFTASAYGPEVLFNSGTSDFTFRTWTSTPEPSSLLMVFGGILALAVFARRRVRTTSP